MDNLADLALEPETFTGPVDLEVDLISPPSRWKFLLWRKLSQILIEHFLPTINSRPGRGGPAGSTHGGGGGGVLVHQCGLRGDTVEGQEALEESTYESQGYGGGGSKSYDGTPGIVLFSIK